MSAPIQRQRRSVLYLILIISSILVILSVGAIAFLPISLVNNPSEKSTSAAQATSVGMGVIQESGNEYIGISNGIYAFDTSRVDGDLKRQGSEKFKSGDKVGAQSLWLQAAAMDTSDAEVLIYLEDLRVVSSGNYITLIVGTMLTGDNSAIGAGRDALQGAYVAQKEYNDGAKLGGGRLIRLLIANSGSKADYATTVAQQIVQEAKQDKSTVGVMGWVYSSRTAKAIDVLSKARIPMVSSTASADELTGISPFFFRVAPSNKYQAIEGAKYAEQQLYARRVALFLDPNDPYSNSLGRDFSRQFTADGYQIVDTENYTVGQKQALPTLLQKALNSKPDLIYFSGYSDDLAVLLINLPASLPNLQVMGGDGLYGLNGYPPSARQGFSRLRFTAFFYPDEWDILGLGGQKPAFFTEYSSNFNPTGQQSPGKYGFTRVDNDVALAYDATTALLKGCQNALDAGNTIVTPVALQQGLTKITGYQAIQGVTGQISFGPDGDPVKKATVILYIDPAGHFKMFGQNGIQGCFQVGQTAC
jgi:eukaryotic-like serine/threonine-protein kinase